jgi:HD-GYP domain-containing protein (c-di-GMP phosphodiesterase class II)
MLHPQLSRAVAIAGNAHMHRTGTAAHAQRVARLAALTALELGHSSAAAGRIRLAGVVHDAGKAWIPEAVLMKPGRLDAREWRLIVAHPEAAASLLGNAPGLEDIREWVLCHHERPDGSGYPRALAHDRIPRQAAILSACDAFDAITSDRPGSPPVCAGSALDELRSHAGRQFDPEVVGALAAAVPTLTPMAFRVAIA